MENYRYLIVHLGYSLKDFKMEKKDHYEAVKKYQGDYFTYYEKLTQLVNKLQREHPELLLIMTPADKSFGKLDPKQIISGNQNGIPDGKSRSYLKSLKSEGVKEIRIAGEFVWHRTIGCLGQAAILLKSWGFNVKAVNECIYPTIKPPEENVFVTTKDSGSWIYGGKWMNKPEYKLIKSFYEGNTTN